MRERLEASASNPLQKLKLSIDPDGSAHLSGDDGRDYEWFYNFPADSWKVVSALIGTEGNTEDAKARWAALIAKDGGSQTLREWLDSRDIDYRFASFGRMSWD